jgi:hypothetical protein
MVKHIFILEFNSGKLGTVQCIVGSVSVLLSAVLTLESVHIVWEGHTGILIPISVDAVSFRVTSSASVCFIYFSGCYSLQQFNN